MAAALVLPVLAYATTALAIEWSASPIALELVTIPESGRLAPAPEPGLLLAQRVLDREWTTRADSLSNSSYVTGGKSELGALAMSAVVPGTGQLYVGERSGFIYLAAEVVAVAGALFFNGKANETRDDAAVVAGVPVDSTSGWSAERWASATSGDPDPVVALYQADPEAYYDRIAKDPSYAAGWSSDAKHGEFITLRTESDDQLQRAHTLEAAVWINHLVSAFDALRAARFYNVPLRRGMELKGNARWKKDGPAVKFAVVQRF
jgi:hypothetical protein